MRLLEEGGWWRRLNLGNLSVVWDACRLGDSVAAPCLKEKERENCFTRKPRNRQDGRNAGGFRSATEKKKHGKGPGEKRLSGNKKKKGGGGRTFQDVTKPLKLKELAM